MVAGTIVRIVATVPCSADSANGSGGLNSDSSRRTQFSCRFAVRPAANVNANQPLLYAMLTSGETFSDAPELPDPTVDWLETDRLGGFASVTFGGRRTRPYHALRLTARRPPTDRLVLFNGCDVHLETGAGQFLLSTQRYEPDTFSPEGFRALDSVRVDPWSIVVLAACRRLGREH